MQNQKTSPSSVSTQKRHNFDTLDWIAAIFVIATPMFIVYKLIWN